MYKYNKLLLLTSTPNVLKYELLQLLNEILPFESGNIYWEILSEDTNLNLDKECNHLHLVLK